VSVEILASVPKHTNELGECENQELTTEEKENICSSHFLLRIEKMIKNEEDKKIEAGRASCAQYLLTAWTFPRSTNTVSVPNASLDFLQAEDNAKT
jgi:hypothetical protein